MAMTDEAPEKATRPAKVNRLFRHQGSDELTSRATNETTHVIFRVVKSGQEIVFDLAQLFPGKKLPEPCVARAAAAFGVNTAAGNMLTGLEDVEKEDPEAVAEAIEHRLATFADGRWSAEREGGGGRPKLIWIALLAFRQEKGQPVDEASMAKFKAKVDDKEAVKSWMANAGFQKHYLRIQAERQASKVSAAKDSDLLG